DLARYRYAEALETPYGVVVAIIFGDDLIGQARTGRTVDADDAGIEAGHLAAGRNSAGRARVSKGNHDATSGLRADARIQCRRRTQLEAGDLAKSSANGIDLYRLSLHGFRELRDVESADGERPAIIEFLQLRGGVTGLDTGAGVGIGRDGDGRGGAEIAVDGKLQGDGAAGLNVAGKGEIDLIFPGIAVAAGVGHRNADSAHDCLDGHASGEVMVRAIAAVVARGLRPEPGTPRNQSLSWMGRRNGDAVDRTSSQAVHIDPRPDVVLNDSQPAAGGILREQGNLVGHNLREKRGADGTVGDSN